MCHVCSDGAWQGAGDTPAAEAVSREGPGLPRKPGTHSVTVWRLEVQGQGVGGAGSLWGGHPEGGRTLPCLRQLLVAPSDLWRGATPSVSVLSSVCVLSSSYRTPVIGFRAHPDTG